MEKKQQISQYRERLDKSLASPELANEDTVRVLVKNQFLDSLEHDDGLTDNVLEKKTREVSNFLNMLRSVSINDNTASHGEWKLKQDNEEFRVMYREGGQGSPFHSLLVEGYVDGPVDACMCISWESELYKKWWPQSSFPPFKVVTSKCLQKVRIGEQISLVRVKVTWPLSAREALVHYFLFEYFPADLTVVLINTISDSESIDVTTHGFTNNGIPEANDVVRIDLVGGFAIQKVTQDRSYFRTIANMDMKLDFVPPSLINFIARQLIGNGFRLYQKSVAAVSNYDEDYSKVLGDPLYARIREALYSTNKSNETHEVKQLNSTVNPLANSVEDGTWDNTQQNTNVNDRASELSPNNERVTAKRAFGEIEEEESEEGTRFDENDQVADQFLRNEIVEKDHINGKRNVIIRSEVEQALGTLEKAISVVREYRFNSDKRFSSSFSGEEPSNLDKGLVKNMSGLEHSGVCCNGDVCVKESREIIAERTSLESRSSSGAHAIRVARANSSSREVNHNRIVPASLDQEFSIPRGAKPVVSTSSENGTLEIPVLEQATLYHKQPSTASNGVHKSSVKGEELSRQKQYWLCCFGFSSAR